MSMVAGKTIILGDLVVISVKLSKVLANIVSDDQICGVP